MSVHIGACVGQSGSWERLALPSLQFLGLKDMKTRRGAKSIAKAYNSIIDEVVQEDADGLILLHDDVEVRSPFGDEFYQLLADDSIAVVGAVGARSPEGMSWWTGPPEGRRGTSVDTFDTHRFSRGTEDVDVVDGYFLGLSKWALRNLRFDEKLIQGFHAYDADICSQARAAGRRVVVTDLDLVHHNKRGISNLDAYFAADFAWRLKWKQAPWTSRLEWRTRRYLHTIAGSLRPRNLAVSGPLSGSD